MRCDMDIDRVVLDAIHFLLEAVRFSLEEAKERIRGRFQNHPNLVIWETERI